MILKVRIEDGMKDATGIEKRAMFLTLLTDIPGLDRIDAVAELDFGSPLQKEIDEIITNMLDSKAQEVRKFKKLTTKAKEKMAKKI